MRRALMVPVAIFVMVLGCTKEQLPPELARLRMPASQPAEGPARGTIEEPPGKAEPSAATRPASTRPAAPAADQGVSRFLSRLDDPRAVYLTAPAFPVRGDGAADDAPALQQAIDLLQKQRGAGVVFIPAGRYRLGKTIDLWKGIRLIGYGRTRPTFVLARNTPGFGPDAQHYLIHFRDARVPGASDQPDAKNTTFASGILNINIEIQPSSGVLAAVRYNVAQLCTLKHVDFRLADDVEAGVLQIGNEIVDCRFFGGRYAIKTGRTSAGWQALLMGCTFEGQSAAAIETHSAGLTVLGCRFSHSPCGIAIPAERTERLYLQDCRFENVAESAILADWTEDPSNQINLDNVTCADVPRLVRFRNRDEHIGCEAPFYLARALSHGVLIKDAPASVQPRHGTEGQLAPLASLPPFAGAHLPPLPLTTEWVNIFAYGARGDGFTDDTQAFRKAVAAARTVYLPAGRYVLSDTIQLEDDTVLVGLHPRCVTLASDGRAPAFADANNPQPLLAAPRGGRNIVAGIGFAPARNPGLVALKWSAGPAGAVDDCFFSFGGLPAGEPRRLGLWVTDGGGGTFKNIWAPNQTARYGLYVSHTATPGRVILASIEHHQRADVRIEAVRNWTFHALQTEALGGTGEEATAVEMTDCEDIRFSNLFVYRTSGMTTPHPHAVHMAGCRDITFRGVHNFSLSRFPFTHSVYDADAAAGIVQHEAACVTIRPNRLEPVAATETPKPPVIARPR